MQLVGAQRQNLQAHLGVDRLNGGDGKAGDERNGDDRLGDEHGRRSVDEPQKAQRSVTGEAEPGD